MLMSRLLIVNGDLEKNLQRHCGMMEVKSFFFNFVDSALRQCIKPEFYQIEKS